jgi:hypothetical protein
MLAREKRALLQQKSARSGASTTAASTAARRAQTPARRSSAATTAAHRHSAAAHTPKKRATGQQQQQQQQSQVVVSAMAAEGGLRSASVVAPLPDALQIGESPRSSSSSSSSSKLRSWSRAVLLAQRLASDSSRPVVRGQISRQHHGSSSGLRGRVATAVCPENVSGGDALVVIGASGTVRVVVPDNIRPGDKFLAGVEEEEEVETEEKDTFEPLESAAGGGSDPPQSDDGRGTASADAYCEAEMDRQSMLAERTPFAKGRSRPTITQGVINCRTNAELLWCCRAMDESGEALKKIIIHSTKDSPNKAKKQVRARHASGQRPRHA